MSCSAAFCSSWASFNASDVWFPFSSLVCWANSSSFFAQSSMLFATASTASSNSNCFNCSMSLSISLAVSWLISLNFCIDSLSCSLSAFCWSNRWISSISFCISGLFNCLSRSFNASFFFCNSCDCSPSRCFCLLTSDCFFSSCLMVWSIFCSSFNQFLILFSWSQLCPLCCRDSCKRLASFCNFSKFLTDLLIPWPMPASCFSSWATTASLLGLSNFLTGVRITLPPCNASLSVAANWYSIASPGWMPIKPKSSAWVKETWDSFPVNNGIFTQFVSAERPFLRKILW